MTRLIIFGGLPGTGKTSIARELARRIHATYVRIDSIEDELRNAIVVPLPLDDVGYRIAYAVALDNLKLGRTVVADSVNPISLTREAWVNVAKMAHVQHLEIEIICSDAAEHRRRVESRVSDIPGFRLPAWADVLAREYHPWARQHVVIDTASCNVEQCVKSIQEILQKTLEEEPGSPTEANDHHRN